LWSFGMFSPFWYIAPIKIWQPWIGAKIIRYVGVVVKSVLCTFRYIQQALDTGIQPREWP
jgi:hypothetical protein